MEETKYGEGKYFVCGEEEKQRWKRRKIFGERKYSFVSGGEGKGIKCLFEEEKKNRAGKRGKYLEREKKNGEGKGGKYFEKEN